MKLITKREAAHLLGVSVHRIKKMQSQKCPACHGKMRTCARCRGTGAYLPTIKFGDSKNAQVLFQPNDLQKCYDRQVGRPKKKSENTPNI